MKIMKPREHGEKDSIWTLLSFRSLRRGKLISQYRALRAHKHAKVFLMVTALPYDVSLSYTPVSPLFPGARR